TLTDRTYPADRLKTPRVLRAAHCTECFCQIPFLQPVSSAETYCPSECCCVRTKLHSRRVFRTSLAYSFVPRLLLSWPPAIEFPEYSAEEADPEPGRQRRIHTTPQQRAHCS